MQHLTLTDAEAHSLTQALREADKKLNAVITTRPAYMARARRFLTDQYYLPDACGVDGRRTRIKDDRWER